MDIKLICILVTFIFLKLPIYFMIFLLVKVKRGALCALHMPKAGGHTVSTLYPKIVVVKVKSIEIRIVLRILYRIVA